MFMAVVQIILIIISLSIVISLTHFLFTGNTPSLTSPLLAREYLLERISLDKSSVFYDLGCGNSKLLRSLAKKYPDSKFIGVDNSFFSYMFSKLAVSLCRLKNIDIRFENFLKSDLSSATHIYLWIYVKDINLLLGKLKKELKRHTLIYSLDFPFDDLNPVETIDLGRKKKFGHTLYIYSVKP